MFGDLLDMPPNKKSKKGNKIASVKVGRSLYDAVDTDGGCDDLLPAALCRSSFFMTTDANSGEFICLGDDGEEIAFKTSVLWGPEDIFGNDDCAYAGYGIYTASKGKIQYPLVANLDDLLTYIKCVHALRSPWHVTW